MNAATAVASHLNIAESLILEVQEWAHVLWVRFTSGRPRFVSKKVKEMSGSVKFKNVEMKPVTKMVMEVYKNGIFFKRMDIKPFSLTSLDIPASEQGAILFELRKISGLGNAPKKAESKPAYAGNKKLNPKWVAFNNLNNEGEEGYNPYPKYI